MCYGVENARAVRIEPEVEKLKPAWNRCFDVSPRQTTMYRLVATGPDDSTDKGRLTVTVR